MFTTVGTLLIEVSLSMKANPSWRIGQHYFNALALTEPDLANSIAGTEKDPFYAESASDPRFVRFSEWLLER